MNRRRKSHGAAIVVALLTLMVVVLITGAVLQSLLVQRRQRQLAENELQAITLAEAAVERALAQLDRDGAYTGESWQVSLATTAAPQSQGLAEIRVAAPRESTAALQIEVNAVYPVDSIRRVVVDRNYTRTKQ